MASEQPIYPSSRFAIIIVCPLTLYPPPLLPTSNRCITNYGRSGELRGGYLKLNAQLPRIKSAAQVLIVLSLTYPWYVPHNNFPQPLLWCPFGFILPTPAY